MPLGEAFELQSLAKFGGTRIITFLRVKRLIILKSLTQLKVWSWITSYFASACFSFSYWYLDLLMFLLSI